MKEGIDGDRVKKTYAASFKNPLTRGMDTQLI